MTDSTTPPAPTLASLQADVAALEFIFAELARTMDPAALLKVLNYLLRNAQRQATPEGDEPSHLALVARLQALIAKVEPEARQQAWALSNEKTQQRKERARHRADSKRQQKG
jgi:hypothetical protein